MIGRLNTNIAAQYIIMSIRLRDSIINDRYCSALDNENEALMNMVRDNNRILDDIGAGGADGGGRARLGLLLLSTLLFPIIVCRTVNTMIEDNVLPNMTISGDGSVLVIVLVFQ